MDIADLINFKGLSDMPVPDDTRPVIAALLQRLELFKLNLIHQLRVIDVAEGAYTDAEAVTAMGAVAAANPLNHVRYTDAEAAAAIAGVYALIVHHDAHDPQTGADPLNCAAAGEIVGVAVAAEGVADTLARSDHVHQVQHSIANNHIVTIDDAAAVDDEYTKFTADGIEGRTYADVRTDINVADGADVAGADHPHQDVQLAATPSFNGLSAGGAKITNVLDPLAGQDAANKDYVDGQFPVTHASTTGRTTDDHHAQAHKDTHDPQTGTDPVDCAAAGEIVGVVAAAEGDADTLARSNHVHQIQHSIADNHIITIDDAGPLAATEYARFTANGLEGRTPATVLADLSGQAAADFDMNTHKIGGVVDPTTDQQAATKKYVDTLTTNHPHQDVNTTERPTFTGTNFINASNRIYNDTFNVYLETSGEVRVQTKGDTSDYLFFTTIADVPLIGTVGACNLKITSGSGLIDFDDENLTTTGHITTIAPTSDLHCATKKYVDDNASGLWEVDGTETQLKTADEIDMQTKKIINCVDPTADQEVATKKYVDDNEYTDAEAVTAVATADKYLKNDADDTTTGKITTIAPTSDLHCATKKYVDDTKDNTHTAFRVTKTSAQTISGSSTDKVTWETESLDDGNDFVIGDNEYVVPADGVYFFYFTWGGVNAGLDDGKLMLAIISKGGVTLARSGAYSSVANSLANASVVCIDTFTTGDKISASAWHDNVADIDINGDTKRTFFCGYRIS